MTKARDLQKNAELCREMAEKAGANSPKKKRLERLADGWNDLARTQAWLDGEDGLDLKAAKPTQELLRA